MVWISTTGEDGEWVSALHILRIVPVKTEDGGEECTVVLTDGSEIECSKRAQDIAHFASRFLCKA